MIIAIDGPAGSGKSTVAKQVASRLLFHYLDTGAMYRACAYRALELGIDSTDEAALAALAKHDSIEFGYEKGEVLPSRVFIAGQDVTDAIRTPRVDAAVSPVSAYQTVRTALVEQQRAIAAQDDYVVEGRDIGTAVFPNAELKVFVTAEPQERARRRAEQNLERGMVGDYDKIYEAILARDKADTEREASPLEVAWDAVTIDTTNLDIEEVIEAIVVLARREQGIS
ncbi:MAG: (d)CMP kinase [Coriobacteriia bacterium]|nr:(d)CMP kinase [Coriobacteriia bacterium]